VWDQLIGNQHMSQSEEWEFLESLDFQRFGAGREDAHEQEQFIKMLYTPQLSEYKGIMIVSETTWYKTRI